MENTTDFKTIEDGIKELTLANIVSNAGNTIDRVDHGLILTDAPSDVIDLYGEQLKKSFECYKYNYSNEAILEEYGEFGQEVIETLDLMREKGFQWCNEGEVRIDDLVAYLKISGYSAAVVHSEEVDF